MLVRPAEIEHFLGCYADALEACDARIALFSLPDRRTFASRNIATLAREAARLARDRKEVYFHIHLHQLQEGALNNRGSIETAGAALGLFADIDARGPGRKKPPETLCHTVADAIGLAEHFNTLYHPLRVSLILASGYGCYPAILFKEPLILAEPEDRQLLESLGRRFHRALHGIASERGWPGAVDYCDLGKVLRLPGCVNWKDTANPKPVRLILQDDSARFNLADLDEWLPPVDPWRGIGQGDAKVEMAGINITLDPADEASPNLLNALAESHPLFTPTWNHQRTDLRDGSCSGYDLALAGIGVARGLTDQQIADVLVVSRRRFRGPKQERRGRALLQYLQRTISTARQGHQSSQEAEGAWAQFHEHIDSQNREDREAPSEDRPEKPPSETAEQAANNQANAESASNESDAQSETRPGGEHDSAGRDEPGGRGCHLPWEFLLAKIRASGSIELLYEHIDMIAALSDGEVAVAYQALKSALGSKLNFHHFNKAIKDARARRQWGHAEQQGVDLRPMIRTDDRLLDEIAVETVAALEAANQPPVVFKRGGALVLIHPDEDGRPVIMRATEPMMRGRLARVARFFKEVKDGVRRVSPPEDLTRDILACNEGQFPPLGVLTQLPILRHDGSLRLEPGYDPVTRAYYQPTPGFVLPPIAAAPGGTELIAAIDSLDEAIGQFPFESAADKANCIGLLLTPILRVTFRMKAPLALIDAPKWGTGKTLLGMVVYAVATGTEGTVCVAPATEEEWRKRMMSILDRGSAVVIIDNIDQTLRSPALSAVLTTSYWEDRILGRSEDVRLPNVSSWIATGNNIVLGAEMGRRAYRIRLDAQVANPAKRTGFKRTDQELLDWVREQRGTLVAALLTMIRAWWVDGRPKADVPAFGSFNTWAQTVGGILHHAGIEEFLGNLETVQQQADEESAQWDQFLCALAIIFGESDFTVGDIVERVLDAPTVLSSSFPDDIGHPDEHRNEGIGSLGRRIGKAFARKCGTRFGDLELRIERARPDSHTKVQRWRVGGDVAALRSERTRESAGFDNVT
ncbi:MAG TPA: hypothetical protein VN428_04450 [Bryobacteraceae bacterium]|nr:hypothetical protein [Bryobacteraceae bacterium]